MKIFELSMSSNVFRLLFILVFSAVLAACGTSNKSGGYYQNDGPGSKNVDIDSIANAVPKREPYIQSTLQPYTVNGKQYIPLQSSVGFIQEGNASWYGKQYHGRKTSTGEVYDMYKMTAAHPTLPLPSYIRVTNVINQRSVVVRVNDRGPFIGNRVVDLSYVAAQKLGIVSAGTGRVIIEALNVDSQLVSNQLSSNTGSSQLLSSQNSSNVVAIGEISQGQSSLLPPQNAPQSTANSQLLPSNSSASAPLSPTTQTSTPPASTLLQTTPAVQQPIASPQVNPNPTTVGLDQRWLQVGAFSVVKNADQLLYRLKLSGYENSEIQTRDGLYKVLVGPVDVNQVDSLKQDLSANGYSSIVARP